MPIEDILFFASVVYIIFMIFSVLFIQIVYRWRRVKRDKAGEEVEEKFRPIPFRDKDIEAEQYRAEMEIELARQRSGYDIPKEIIDGYNPSSSLDVFPQESPNRKSASETFQFTSKYLRIECPDCGGGGLNGRPAHSWGPCSGCEGTGKVYYFGPTLKIGDGDTVPVEKIEFTTGQDSDFGKSQTAAIRQRSFDDAFGTCTTTNESYLCPVCHGKGFDEPNGGMRSCHECDGRGLDLP